MRKILFAFALICTSVLTYAAGFTAGNIVVLRMGNGSAALTSASTVVYLDEYTPAGALVQSIAVPAATAGSNHALTLSGVATSEGMLTLSPTGAYLTFTGFDTVPGYAGVASGITNRTVARVDASGTINTSTGFTAGSAFVAGNIRGAVTADGNEFWAVGSGSTTGGVWYLPFGSFTAAGTQISTTLTSVRNVNIFNNQLYITPNGAGIYSVGTGLPTTAGQTETILPGLPTTDSTKSPYAFVMLDENSAVAGNDVLYVADEDTTSGTGGIYKYSLVGGVWVSNGNAANANLLRGLTGSHSCNGTMLYATAGNGIYSFHDAAGYNQTISGTYTTIATASTNTLFRGVAFAPGTVMPTDSILVSDVVTAPMCHDSATGRIDLTVAGGTPAYTYTWSNSLGSTIGVDHVAAGNYTVTVADQGGCSTKLSISVSEPTAVTVTLTAVNVSANGAGNGMISAAVSGGTSPYSYSWSTGAHTDTITNLTPAQYCLTVYDGHDCKATACDSISQPLGVNDIAWVQDFTAYAGAGAIHVDVTAKEAMNIAVEIYDLTGKKIYNNTQAHESHVAVQFSDADITAGCYIVRVSTGQGSVSRRVIVTK